LLPFNIFWKFFSNYVTEVWAPVEINIFCLLNTALCIGKNMKKWCQPLIDLVVWGVKFCPINSKLCKSCFLS